MATNEAALQLLEQALVGSAHWCLANPSIAAMAPKGPPAGVSVIPPSDRPSFQGLIRDLMALGQTQGLIRRDKAPEILAAVLLGSHAQMMSYALASGTFEDVWIGNPVRLLIEGFGARARVKSVSPRAQAGTAARRRRKKQP
jgi:hypothetical protein